jgi:chromosome segregation ATPase
MKVAREIAPGSRLASLPYSKALALLSAPAEEREELAEIADDRSAGEIRKLIEERNRAAAAANAETARADHAEEDAKKYYDEAAALRTTLEARNAEIEEKSLLLCDYLNRISNAKDRLKDAREREEQLKGQLMEAENHRIEVEVAPADYEQLKRDRADLTEAAARAEERAAELEEELEALRAESAGREDAAKTLRVSMTAFMADCGTMPARPETLARSREKIERNLTILESWCEAMREALANAVSIEAVMIE